MSLAEGKSTPKAQPSKKIPYEKQIDEEEETNQGYMMLVPIRKKPVIQMFLVFAAMVLAIAALIRDEIMDGDITFSSTSYWHDKMSEVDYDCGYSQLRFTYIYSQGYEQSESYTYDSSLCEQNEYIFSTNFCSGQSRNGKVWLACGIIGIVFNAISIIVVYRRGRHSLIYLALVTLSTIFYSTSAFDWLSNERCSDMESNSTSNMTLDTSIGSSMVLMLVAAGLCVFAMLISLIFLIRSRKRTDEGNSIPLPNINTTQIAAR